jgi:hypothetical protein
MSGVGRDPQGFAPFSAASSVTRMTGLLLSAHRSAQWYNLQL